MTWIHAHDGHTVLQIDPDIVDCASKIIKMEAACMEWGATAARSVELAALEINELLIARSKDKSA